MDTLKDIFKDLKDRMSSPFFSSFLISWLLVNWRITVSFIFYNSDSIKLQGYKSYIDLIEKNDNLLHFLMIPTGLAAAYTFGYPAFKNLISASNAFMTRWGQKLNFGILKTSYVDGAKYIELRTKYQKEIKDLTELYKKENSFSEENSELKLQIQKKQVELDQEKIKQDEAIDKINGEHSRKLFDWEQSFSSKLDEVAKLTSESELVKMATQASMVNGYWVKTIGGVAEAVKFQNGNILNKFANSNEYLLVSKIIHFYYDQITRDIFFITKEITSNNNLINYNTYKLTFSKDENAMIGIILNRENVGFIRTSQIKSNPV